MRLKSLFFALGLVTILKPFMSNQIQTHFQLAGVSKMEERYREVCRMLGSGTEDDAIVNIDELSSD